MKFCKIFNKTILYIAVEKRNIDIVKLLLACENIDINALSIFKTKLFIKIIKKNLLIIFKNKSLNKVHIKKNLIAFKNKSFNIIHDYFFNSIFTQIFQRNSELFFNGIQFH